jgi:hypothetical protein
MQRRIQKGAPVETVTPFETELRVFEQHRAEWSRSHRGEFVAIQGEEIAEGFFGTYSDALKAGLQRFGVRNEFLIKQVWTTEPVYYIS